VSEGPEKRRRRAAKPEVGPELPAKAPRRPRAVRPRPAASPPDPAPLAPPQPDPALEAPVRPRPARRGDLRLAPNQSGSSTAALAQASPPGVSESHSEDPEPLDLVPMEATGAYRALWNSGLLNVGAIARREIAAYFVSPIGYVVGAVLIVLVSLLGYLGQIVAQVPVGMDQVFSIFALFMVFFTPLYTMRLVAEERRSGTLEVLLTSPVRDSEVVLGKWLAGLVFYLATAAFTLVYVVLIAHFGSGRNHYLLLGHAITIPGLDPGPLLTGYIGLILVGAAWVALGILASTLTSNQIIAAVIGIGLLIFFEYLSNVLSAGLQGQASSFFGYLSAANRAQSFNQGRLVGRDVIYFLSLVGGALFLATRVLDSRRWR